MFLVSNITNEESYMYHLILKNTEMTPGALILLIILLNLALSLWFLWGTACVLLVGKRIIKSPAGRSRSSFKLVRKQAAKLIIPLFLTDILRDCFTLFWGILLIVPGIIYRVRTLFYAVIIACEKKEYRKALKQSKKIVKGHSWTVFWYMLGLGIVIFLPTTFLTLIVDETINGFDSRLSPAADILNGAIFSIAVTIQLLATIILYKEIKKLK